MLEGKKHMGSVPLLEPFSSGRTASSMQTLVNIIVSIVGTGILGLPFAFKIAGWFSGSLGVLITGITTLYCMFLLIDCRKRLALEGLEEVKSYGDLGAKIFGKFGRIFTEILVFVSQCGGAVAYLIFIGQNLSSIFKSKNLESQKFIFFLVPVEIALSFIRSLSTLSPFSAFADVCNVLAMAIVIKQDLQLFDGFSEKKAVTNWGSVPFASGVAVFCFEGFSMTLPLEASMREPGKFRWVLALAMTLITSVYICFGFFGYLAYGEETRDIVTLNLPSDWSATAVKIGLCVALTFTFPIMMHPIYDIFEEKLKGSLWFQKSSQNSKVTENFTLHLSRAMFVILLAILASFVPGFGMFVSLVGSTFCALLSFVLPAIFHLVILQPAVGSLKRLIDYCLIVAGIIFAGHGTYQALTNLFRDS